MALPEFDYIAAKSYEEASKLMVSMGSECVVMSGGTDVILQIPKFENRYRPQERSGTDET